MSNGLNDGRRGIDFIGVCCVFLCHDGKGNFLLSKRSQNCRDEQGNWDPGAGAMEHGETFEETLAREIREEYCTDVLDSTFVGIRNVLRDNNGIKTHWIGVDFFVCVDPKKVAIGEPNKIDEVGWFTKHTIPSPMHSQWDTFFARVLAHGLL